MSLHIKLLKLTVLLSLVIPSIQACQIRTSDATLTAQAILVQQTQVAVVQQTHAAIVQQTETSLAGLLQQTATPNATPTLQVLFVPSGTQPVSTVIAPPAITPQLGAIGITYGQTLSGYPKSQHILYVFSGNQADNVTILLVASILGATRPYCTNHTSAHTTFTLKTPRTKLFSTNQTPQYSYIRDYLLPDSGTYFIDVVCSGSLCNCTQTDLSLEKK